MAERACPAIVVGGGPAGLMAAEVLSAAGLATLVVDRMPTLGRKLLMAGRGGLNLTHSEPFERLLTRYGQASARLAPSLHAFPPADLIAWSEGLGQSTFIGSSGRVFPKAMKASPLLRAWAARLERQGVTFRTRHRWVGFQGATGLAFVVEGAAGPIVIETCGVILALGGASWPRLGSDGAWRDILIAAGIATTPLTAANCGVRISWSTALRARFEGQPVKRVALAIEGRPEAGSARGEVVITGNGLEGSPVYALAPSIRAALVAGDPVRLCLDLRPDIDVDALAHRLAVPRHKQSVSTFLRKAAGLSPAAIALLREAALREPLASDAEGLARRIKTVRLDVNGLASLDRAISTAGGIAWDEVDENLMLRRRPGIFVAGEMLDWEAPTGGYLLQACLATGRAAGQGLLRYLGAGHDSAGAAKTTAST